MEVRKWNGSGTLEASDYIIVGYDTDDDEIEAKAIIKFDHSPAEPDVGMREESFNIVDIRYEDGQPVEPRLISAELREAWEESAPELAAEHVEGLREDAAEAKRDAKRDGE